MFFMPRMGRLKGLLSGHACTEVMSGAGIAHVEREREAMQAAPALSGGFGTHRKKRGAHTSPLSNANKMELVLNAGVANDDCVVVEYRPTKATNADAVLIRAGSSP